MGHSSLAATSKYPHVRPDTFEAYSRALYFLKFRNEKPATKIKKNRLKIKGNLFSAPYFLYNHG